MATNSMVPYANAVGNNQTTPGAGAGATKGTPTMPVPTPLTSPTAAAAQNPLVPVGAGTPTIATPPIGTATNATNTLNQETDIYGQGVGTDITNLLNSIGGTNSATLQEYGQSLAPQEASAKANLDASLGAGGVSANSSVAALGNANLQAQETATIAGEDASLTQSGQNLEAEILTGQQQQAAQEVSASGWNVFGQVAGDLGGLAATTITAAGKAGGFSDLF